MDSSKGAHEPETIVSGDGVCFFFDPYTKSVVKLGAGDWCKMKKSFTLI